MSCYFLIDMKRKFAHDPDVNEHKRFINWVTNLLRVSCCSHEAGRVSYMHVPLVKISYLFNFSTLL
jgi:hypothetical protein